MVKLFLNDESLYERDEINYTKSLSVAKTLPTVENAELVFHCFWRVPRSFGRKQAAVLRSIIVSHRHKINKIKINIWSNVDLSENEFLTEMKPYLNFKIWDLENEKKNTILEESEYMKHENVNDDLCWLEGDLFRLLILNKYGGFYIDMDTLIIRDLSPLSNFEFLYSWGAGLFPNEPRITMNGAVMRLEKNSSLSNEFLEILKEVPPGKNSTSWGNNLYSMVKKNEVLVLPCVWFDSEWGFENTVMSPFQKVENTKFFDGCFTWHWHNRWDDEIEIGSKFEIIEKKHKEIFKEIIND